ncbi:MAG: hypothetical protein L6R35_006998 [Caloplaca aegaea]|nr:MAG: hypothetical protein L6R35_006998 [Caloplaca aegaea]
MRAVTVNPEAKTVTAQGGCIWEDVDAAAGTYGLTTVGGTVKPHRRRWPHSRRGLWLALRPIITTSASEKHNLFWAIRGVATSFTFRAHEQKDPVFAGTMTFTPHKIPAAVALANRLAEAGSGQAGFVLGFAVAPPPVSQPTLMSVIFHNGPQAEAEAFFKPLFDLEPVMNTTAMIPYPHLNAMLNPPSSLPVRAEFMLTLFDNFAGFVREVPDASGSLLLFEFFNQDKICQTSNRAMAFANRDFYGNVMAGPKWHDEANDGRCRQWARDVTDLLRREMEAVKIAGQVKVGNGRRGPVFGEKGLDDLWSELCNERLVELKWKYDPKNLFSKGLLLAPQKDA